MHHCVWYYRMQKGKATAQGRAWPQGQHPRLYPKMAGCWVLGYTQASTATATLLRPAPRSLSCWSVCAAGLHPSMPACQQLGVLACWGACQQHRQHFSPPPSLAGHRPACQHASMPTTGDAGMLGCTPVAQIDQHYCPPPSLASHQ